MWGIITKGFRYPCEKCEVKNYCVKENKTCKVYFLVKEEVRLTSCYAIYKPIRSLRKKRF